ncbi:MAG: glycoside hydrolase domain-containing protein [Phycisphaeraceae bacterium]
MHAQSGSDQGWNGSWEMANQIDEHTNRWIAELSVPLTDFGITGDVIGRKIGLLVARNYKRPWAQATYMRRMGSFRNFSSYTRLRLTDDAPVVRIERLGEYGDNEWGQLYERAMPNVRVRIVNPGEAREARLKLHGFTTDMPGIDETETLELPAEDSAEYEFAVSDARLHSTAQHSLRLTITDPEQQQTWLDYSVRWALPENYEEAQPWNVITGPQPKQAFRLAYYPSHQLLRARFDPSELAEADAGSRSAELTLTHENGEQVLRETVSWGEAPAEQQFDLPELAPGTYTATARLNRYDEPIEVQFQHKLFPWQATRMGVTDQVLPPFEPIEIDGDTVAVVLRRYEMTGLGFWSSIEAKGQDADEDYKELLTGPIELVANDQTPLEGNGRFVSKADDHVVYEGKAEHSAVTTRVRTTTEEDGCARIELTLAPGQDGEALESLSLRIPLRDALMPLYHV